MSVLSIIDSWGRMPHYLSSNSFSGVDIPLRHYFKKEIEDLTIKVMDHNKGGDDGI